LVQRILTATKALEKLKTTNDIGKIESVQTRLNIARNKTQDEYYEENLQLKKVKNIIKL
jgi:hypothetical protein